MAKLHEVQANRADIFGAAETLVARIKADKRDFNAAEQAQYNAFVASIKVLDEQIARLSAHSTPSGGHSPFGGVVAPDSPVNMERFNSELGNFMRGKIMAADIPLYIGTGAGVESVGETVPTQVLSHLPAYSNLDSFRLAGARVLDTTDTNPLVLPIISAGGAASTYAEGASATESQPFELDSFTLGGVKYARLVKVSEEALMNSALPLQSVILDELAAGVASTFTSAHGSPDYSVDRERKRSPRKVNE